MKELKIAALILNVLVILVLTGGFLFDSTSGATLAYFATVLMISFPSLVSVFAISNSARQPKKTSQSNGLHWIDIVRMLALAANGIYFILVINTIYEGKFNAYVAMLAGVYLFSFYVLWRDRQEHRK